MGCALKQIIACLAISFQLEAANGFYVLMSFSLTLHVERNSNYGRISWAPGIRDEKLLLISLNSCIFKALIC